MTGWLLSWVVDWVVGHTRRLRPPGDGSHKDPLLELFPAVGSPTVRMWSGQRGVSNLFGAQRMYKDLRSRDGRVQGSA